MVDIHSHILPEVDDGPKSWDVSVAMCRAAAADGITHMVATPHANDRYHYDREYLQGLVAHLQELVGDAPKLSLGCDFHLSYENLQDAMANPTRYVIEGTRYQLVEFSNFSVPQQTTDSFLKLGDCGITPVITHPERNPILRENPQRVVEWAEQGCVVQLTGSALTGFWGERTPRCGCSNTNPSMCSPRMRMTQKSVCRFSPARAMPPPKFAVKKLPKRWSRAIPALSLPTSPCLIFPGQ